MEKKLGDTIVIDFITSNPNYGSVQTADALPTCEVFRDVGDSAILFPTVVQRTNKTGNYRVQIYLSDPVFSINKSYSVVVSATVAGISSKSVIGNFDIDAFKRPTGSIVADGSNTASTFKTDLTDATTDLYKDCLLVFITGTLGNQVKKISAYNGGTNFITLTSALTSIPTVNDKFLIINL